MPPRPGLKRPPEAAPEVTDNDALARLYAEERPRLVRALRRELGDVAANDLVQDGFVRLAARPTSAQPIERPAAFLFQIVRNLLRNDRAQRARRHADQHVPADEERLPPTDPFALLESRDMLARVERAIARLKPRTREIFLANRVEGLSYAEIAERTGLSVKGVEKQMSKAIAALDRMVERR